MTASDAFNLACPSGDNCPEAKGPDFDFGSSPSLVDLPHGKRALVAGQKSGMVHAVDPDQQGEALWQTRVGKGGSLGGVQWGSATDGRNVYVALSDFSSVKGVKAAGGSLDGPGPVVVGGMLYLNSGYGAFGGMPGNVLLAFSVDGR